ncbi:Tetraacyldisaccharide 4'-kinase,tetraacyldisaccharide 4'-kinase,tetraacyldisaccharide 4'-kinase,Tetraacyldisaccharide-1-P 4'-kinase [Chlamydia serpentis]|uniref:Tetraacyldisaccharide 4'-kinase n=1 Tax=Chlamydia serpentis TaxID=1967782 RepID=A0A2R8FB49_9CHLA|nr:tetraacyldisaccharide 4'-kinase [Chlamydia serpentis]SPN73648.1 Tetraacyldisaccharide 4'-kinase,tetraacyldisaccharide 4'-kinase,tetraacyldisaccharide 4'-kinase,Tetraacyldisaccharide-1-P 4'-kinase [Chlamydia serpentis]
MKKRFPSPLFFLYRRLTLAISLEGVLGWGQLGSLLSKGFSCLVACWNWLPLPSPLRVRATVISVGNIVIGGAGKTPTVLWLAEALRLKGYSCGVLSRGYKSESSRRKELTIVNAKEHSASYVGDEPLLMAEKLPEGCVWVHKDRRVSAAKAAEKFDFLLLDDGLQYRKLHKDIEIAVVNGQDPLGGHAFFPKGRLRDFPARLKTVDAIVINDGGEESETLVKSISDALRVSVVPKIASVVWTHNGEHISEETLRDLRVGVFCGLGFPQGFLNMLKKAGIRVLGKYLLPDHVGITKKELNYFCQQMVMRQGQGLLCTEKDSVKLPRLSEDSSLLPIGKVQMRLSVNEENATSLLNMIDQIHKNRGN